MAMIATTTPYLYLAYIWLAAVAVAITLIVLTARSNFNKDRKLLLYITSILLTPLGVDTFSDF